MKLLVDELSASLYSDDNKNGIAGCVGVGSVLWFNLALFEVSVCVDELGVMLRQQKCTGEQVII